jgi:hypothetical protein
MRAGHRQRDEEQLYFANAVTPSGKFLAFQTLKTLFGQKATILISQKHVEGITQNDPAEFQ